MTLMRRTASAEAGAPAGAAPTTVRRAALSAAVGAQTAAAECTKAAGSEASDSVSSGMGALGHWDHEMVDSGERMT